MADATFTFRADGAQSVTQSTERISKGMNNVKRASSRSGYAVLEASRALEDFTMAGMRGALNNIPPLLMGLGVGAGLTGVLAGVTVAAWQAHKAIDAMFARADAKFAKQKEKQTSLNLFDLDVIRQGFGDEAVKNAQIMQDVIGGISDRISYMAGVNKNAFAVYDAEESAKGAEMQLYYAELGLTSEELKIKELENQKKLQDDILHKSKKEANLQYEHLESLIAQKKVQEEISNKVSISLGQEIKMAGIKAGRQAFDDLPASKRGTVAHNRQMQEASEQAQRKMRLSKGFETILEMTSAAKEAEIAREKLKLLDQEIKKKGLSVAESQRDIVAQEEINGLNKEKIDWQIKLSKFQATQKADEEARQSAMAKRVVDTSPFLSSQGKAGLAGREAASAMDAIGIQKNMLQKLKEIATNTRRGGTVYG